MIDTHHLDHLEAGELAALQKHVKLGKTHLQRHLTPREVADLFALGEINPQVEHKMALDPVEVSGKLSMSINSFFAGVVGVSTGIASLINLHIQSPPVIGAILLTAGALGAFLGWHNYWYLKKNAEEAIEKRKLKRVEIHLLHAANSKREEESRKKIRELISMLHELGIKHVEAKELISKDFNEAALCKHWLNKLVATLPHSDFSKHPLAYQALLQEVEESKGPLKRAQDREVGEVGKICHKLRHASPQPPLPARSWLRSNWRFVLISIFPVMFGAAGSILAYFNHTPKIAKALGQAELLDFLARPEVRVGTAYVAAFVTVYFAFSFIYTNMKAFEREEELKKSSALRDREENRLQFLEDQLLKIRSAEEVVKPLFRLSRALHYANA